MAPTRTPRPTARPIELVALHGFTGSGADFELVQDTLAALGPPLVRWTTPDLPGHGAHLDADDDAFTVPAMAAAVAATLASRSSPRVLLGYSMGGRVALRLALDHPDVLDALVLIGAHPGLEEPAARADRATADAARAARIRSIGGPAFCREWAAHPLIATQARIPEPYRTRMRARRACNDAAGLARATALGGLGAMTPLWSRLPEIRHPTLLVSGDPKYHDVAARMAGALPAARWVPLEGAGHAAHLEAPSRFARTLHRFLATVIRRP